MEELILKQFDSEVKAVEGERAFNVTITTNTADRSGDIVEPKGAKLTNFRKNPVVLMAHNYQGLPIAKAKDLAKTDNGITAKVIFPDEGIYSLADTVYNLYKNGFMKAWSIGFIPIKSEDIVDEEDSKKMSTGRRFKTWELLEFSGCAVPNNPDTLNNMLKKGIDVKPLEEAGFIEVEDNKLVNDEKINKAAEDIAKKALETETVIKVDEEEVKEIIKDGLKDVKADPIDTEKVKDSIEKDEKDKSFICDALIDRLSVIQTENKELKEKLKDIELKAGAVLNVKNKKDLKTAQVLIQSVLDSATTGEEEDSLEITDEKGEDDKGDNTVVDLVTDTVDDPPIDEKEDEDKMEVDEKVIAETIDKHMNYIVGKLEKSDT